MKTMKMASTAVAALLMAACTNEDLVVSPGAEQAGTPMTFSAATPNGTRATAFDTDKTFGVFAYKMVGSEQQVMLNYEVAHSTSTAGSTWEADPDPVNYTDGKSMWYYEGLNNQYLKYWDPAATSYDFFAYTPYNANAVTSTPAAWDEDTKVLTFGNVAARTSPITEYMVASEHRDGTPTNVSTADVQLTFVRFNGLVQLAIYETILGYRVQMTSDVEVSGDVVKSGILRYDYANKAYHFTSPEVDDIDLTFTKPVAESNVTISGVTYNNILPQTRPLLADSTAAGFSATQYYCMPMLDAINGDLTMTLSYDLISEDTNEIIKRVNRTVVIGANYVKWEPNHKYTYVLRIQADDDLKPIVFDGIFVEDYDKTDNDQGDWIVGTSDGEPDASVIPAP